MEALKGLDHVQVDKTIEAWYQKATMFEEMVEDELHFRMFVITGIQQILVPDYDDKEIEKLAEAMEIYAGKTAELIGLGKKGGQVDQGGRAGAGGPEGRGGEPDRGGGQGGGDPGKEN
jgi:hypothetical protein